MSASLDRDIGRVLGDRYRIVAPLGAGASARVFLADDITLRRQVAIKVLHPGLAQDAQFLKRFQAEAQSAASLNSPNVLGVYDWGNEDEPFIVSEFLGGGSLRSMLDAGHRLTLSQALLVGLEAARGLEYAHGQDLIHRDIKPANLLFDDRSRLRIADFGLARAIAEAGWTDEEGSMVGTARYAAPEQARGERVGPAADIYSLGLVINEAVTGTVPFEADTMVATLMARVDEPFVPSGELGPLAPVLEYCGSVDPEDRPTASELVAMLAKAATMLSKPEPLPLTPSADLPEVGIARTQHGTLHAATNTATRAELLGEEDDDDDRGRLPALLLLIALIAGVGAAGFGAWVATRSSAVEVPAVIGMARPDAVAELASTGLVLNFEDVRLEGSEPGEVVGVIPDEGTELEPGDEITLQISLGEPLVVIPDLAGLTTTDAQAALERDGLVFGETIEFNDETVESGLVIAADVTEGVVEVEVGTVVDVLVSIGPAERVLPEIGDGDTYGDVELDLLELRLVPAQAEAFDDEVPEGEVISFDPPSGSSVPVDSVITVTVSLGPAPREVPSVIGLDVVEATEILEAEGFVVVGVQGPADQSVLATDPLAGETHPFGTEVVIATSLTAN